MVLREVRTLVCRVLNVTPDSFSDAGRFLGPGLSIANGLELASTVLTRSTSAAGRHSPGLSASSSESPARSLLH
jgi:hypothetical protein